MKNPVRVLIVDDSALVRKLLTSLLDEDPGITVVGTASDAYIAREKIKELDPDVLTLDIEMPRMDGITFLRNLMRLRPMPVVMISSPNRKRADATFEALELGAIEFINKPTGDLAENLVYYREEIISKVKLAAAARILPHENHRTGNPDRRQRLPSNRGETDRLSNRKHFATRDAIIAIGASTGGTEAIREVLEALPSTMPATVITQHIPAAFSKSFAARLNSVCEMNVCEARNGQEVLPGHVYIAPGDQHLLLVRDGACFRCKLSNGPPVNRHKPSVDVMFRSVAESAGSSVTAVLLTGMGDDGAAGMKELRETGALTIAQDEESSVVWGMPGSAVRLGAAEEVLPLDRIADYIVSWATSGQKFGT